MHAEEEGWNRIICVPVQRGLVVLIRQEAAKAEKFYHGRATCEETCTCGSDRGGKAPYRNSSMCGASHLKPDDALRSAGALGSNPTPANSRGAGNAAELGKWLV